MGASFQQWHHQRRSGGDRGCLYSPQSFRGRASLVLLVEVDSELERTIRYSSGSAAIYVYPSTHIHERPGDRPEMGHASVVGRLCRSSTLNGFSAYASGG